jgi:hypothetical protein
MPKRQGDETLRSFQERFCQHYAAKIEERFTGDPQNISLSLKWQRVFSKTIGSEGT